MGKIKRNDFEDLVIFKVLASDYNRDSKVLFLTIKLDTKEFNYVFTLNKIIKLETLSLDEAILEYNKY